MIKAFISLFKSLPWPAKLTTVLLFTFVPVLAAFALLAFLFALLVQFLKWMRQDPARLTDPFWRRTFITSAYIFGFLDVLLNYIIGSFQFHRWARWKDKTYSQTLNFFLTTPLWENSWQADMANFMGTYIINRIAEERHIRVR